MGTIPHKHILGMTKPLLYQVQFLVLMSVIPLHVYKSRLSETSVKANISTNVSTAIILLHRLKEISTLVSHLQYSWYYFKQMPLESAVWSLMIVLNGSYLITRRESIIKCNMAQRINTAN